MAVHKTSGKNLSQSQPKQKPKPQSVAEPHPKSVSPAHPKSDPKTELAARSKRKSGPKSESAAQTKRKSELTRQSAAQPQPNSDLKSESVAESQRKLEVTPQSAAQPQPTSDLKSESVAESQRKLEVTPQSAAQTQPISERKSESEVQETSVTTIDFFAGTDTQVAGILTPTQSLPSPSATDETSDEEKWEKQLKKRRVSSSPSPTPPTCLEYEVEEILEYVKDENNKLWYRVKWKGYQPREDDPFEPLSNLINCNALLLKFHKKLRPGQRRSKFGAMREAVEKSLPGCPAYKRLVASNYGMRDIHKFPYKESKWPQLGPIFSRNPISVENRLIKDYNRVLQCLVYMGDDADVEMLERAQHLGIALKVCSLRRNQLEMLRKQEAQINEVEQCAVTVRNDVDLDVLDESVTYVAEMRVASGIHVPNDPLMGCACASGCSPNSNCCGKMMDSEFAYTKEGRLKHSGQIPIFECNWRCSCPPDCRNRVVQRGRKYPVCVFKTKVCGWGVRSACHIPKGAFVCEYIGELTLESRVRDANTPYIFDLDFSPDRDAAYCVDATTCGNVARYINHSCQPNLVVRPVWVDCIDRDLPKLAFFSSREIHNGEELTIDYESRNDGAGDAVTERSWEPHLNRCLCKSSNCRKWIGNFSLYF